MEKRIINEINHGKYIASRGEEIWNWSSPAGKIRWKRRAEMFRKFIGNDNKYVLEVGCGTGLFSKEIVKTQNTIISIDISPNLLLIAKRKIKSKNIKFIIGNVCKTGFQNNTFDFIIGSSILHHLDIDRSLLEFYRILKPGGKIMFTEPNFLNPQIALERSTPYFRKLFNNSPDESAFFRWTLKLQFQKHVFSNINIVPFDFLHPNMPSCLIKFLYPICLSVEKIPIIKEFSGSLVIKAEK